MLPSLLAATKRQSELPPRHGLCLEWGLRPHNVELALCSSDGLLERLGAIGRPGVRVARFLYVPIGRRAVRRLEREVGSELRTAQPHFGVPHDHGADLGLRTLLFLGHVEG